MMTFLRGASMVLVVLAFAATAAAQATRTWVSGVGDDANPCSRTAPCKTFAGAISKTAAGGEINATDPAGFGAVTITKSITIDGGGTMSSILASLTNGININGAGIVVTLRHLSINGAGNGLIGVNVVEAQHVNIEDCDIFGFGGANGRGVSFGSATTTTNLYISNTNIHNNLTDGVFFKFGNAMIDRTSLVGNGQDGLQVDGTTGATVVMISNSTVALNGTGIHATAGGIARMTHLDIFGHAAGNAWFADGGTIETHVDNRIRGTGTGALTPVVYP